MFWFQIKTKYGCVRVAYCKHDILTVSLTNNAQKKDKYYKIYAQLRNDLLKYFSGQKTSFAKYEVNCDNLSSFEKEVLGKTRLIPYGETKSYSQLAEEIGGPKASRAAGNALSKNPAPIIIPCHRVVRKNGELGGFSEGTKWKKILLFLERGGI